MSNSMQQTSKISDLQYGMQAPAEDGSYQDAIHFLAYNIFVESNMRKAAQALCELYHIDWRTKAPEMPYGEAVQLYLLHGQKAEQNARNLAAASARAVTTHAVTVTDGTIVYKEGSTDVTLKSERGFFVDPGSDKQVIIDNHVAHALAYTYTCREASAPPALVPNFCKPNSSFLPVLNPVATMLPPIGYVPKLSEKNVDLFINLMGVSIPSRIYTYGYYHFARSKSGTYTNHPPDAVNERLIPVEDADRFKPQVRKLLVPQDNKLCLRVPMMLNFPTAKSATLDLAYQTVHVHRNARGQDKKWVSPLTSGYYYGSLDAGVTRTLGLLMDVLHVMLSMKAVNVLFTSRPANGVMLSLVANKMIVQVYDPVKSDPLRYHQGQIVPGIYRTTRREPAHEASIVFNPETTEAPSPEKGGSINYKFGHVEMSANLQAAGLWGGYYVTNQRLCPVIFDAQNRQKAFLFPTHTPHNGSILMMTGGLKNLNPPEYQCTVEKMTARMITANICKSHFPFNRARFLPIDRTVYGFRSLALATPFTLQMNVTKEKIELANLTRIMSDDTLVAPIDDDFYTGLVVHVPYNERLIYQDALVPIQAAHQAPLALSRAPPVTSTTTTTTTSTAPVSSTVTTTTQTTTESDDDDPYSGKPLNLEAIFS